MPMVWTKLAAAAGENVSTLFVVLMGVGTVFVGLICIILLCLLVGAFFRGEKKPADAPAAAPVSEEIPRKQEMLAAVSAALAEELGTEVSAIRILSFKRL